MRKVAFKANGDEVHELVVGLGVEWSKDGHSALLQLEELGIHFDAADVCTLHGPFGAVVITDPGPGARQLELVRHMVMMATEQDVPVKCLRDLRVVTG